MEQEIIDLAAGEVSTTKKYTVVLVDDSMTTITILKKILERENIEVHFFTDPHEFLEQLSTITVDLFLFDVMMPGINGMELCRIVKKKEGFDDIPVIFITGQGNTGSVIKGFEAGAVDYIKKPFDAFELLARINTHLELKESKEQLRTMNAAKDRFLSIIAHDIRNPLTYIIGVTSLFIVQGNTSDFDEMIDAMKKIYDASGDVMNMLNNVLHWARSQMGGVSVRKETFDCYELVEKSINQIQKSADAKDIVLENGLDAGMELFADKTMLVIIMRNLLGNAVKFSYPQSKITVLAEEEPDYWVLGIKDRGMGISKANLSKLFKIDEHVSTAGTNKESGSGLGLILCKELVEKQEGTLWVTSEEKKGTTIFFKLPKSG